MRLASIVLLSALIAAPIAAPVAAPVAAQTTSAPSGPLPMAHPLQRLAAEQMVILPVQYLTFADSLGWSESVPSTRSYLNTVDNEIAFALTQRGLKGRWTMAPDLERSVARNQGYAPDPRDLTAGEVRSAAATREWQLHEPLASQLRSLIALTDARYVLFPVEMRITGSHGYGHATLHLVIIDARRSQVQWAGDLSGEPMAKFSPAIAADIASRLGDLIAAPIE
ncbi:MAG: hypothetical protein ABI338_05780 [Gemmatimonadaceae bacterium]